MFEQVAVLIESMSGAIVQSRNPGMDEIFYFFYWWNS
jgi:hypothetical protein